MYKKIWQILKGSKVCVKKHMNDQLYVLDTSKNTNFIENNYEISRAIGSVIL